MCTENIYLAGRYNKYLRNLSQSPWIDKDDVRIKDSVQELIEEGLNKYLRFDKSVFSSSGREDVDVRMLGKGRPFVFKIVNPFNPTTYDKETMAKIQKFINLKHKNKIQVRYLQVVSKEGVSTHLKDGQESKTKEYRALCCCSKKLTSEDVDKISKINDLDIDQKTPIRVLHRRSLLSRPKQIHRMRIDQVKLEEFDCLKPEDLDHVFTLTLLTEAGTYIKEFVHGDFGRTEPSLSTLLGDCDTDLVELDVMVIIFPLLLSAIS